MLTRFAACALIAASSLPSWAAGEDLVNCRWPNGDVMKPQVCQYLQQATAREQATRNDARRIAEENKARRDAQAVASAAAANQAREVAASRAMAEAAQAARQEAAEAERAQANLARFEAEDRERKAAAAKFEREIAQDEARRSAFVAAKKRTCGAEYAKPSIGMSIERVRSCVGDLTLVSQVNRQDGVASVYTAGRLHLVVMGGKVVAWQRH